MAKSRWMNFQDRQMLEKKYSEGMSIADIADSMNRNRGTIYRELRNGSTGQMDKNGRLGYSALTAQKRRYELSIQKTL